MKFKLLHHEDVWQERGCLLAFSIGITTWYYIILNNIVSITSLHRSLITERHREQNHDRAYAATQALPMPDTINSTSQISSIFQRHIHENNIHIDSSNQAYIHAYITPNTTTHTRNNNILAGVVRVVSPAQPYTRRYQRHQLQSEGSTDPSRCIPKTKFTLLDVRHFLHTNPKSGEGDEASPLAAHASSLLRGRPTCPHSKQIQPLPAYDIRQMTHVKQVRHAE